MHAAPVADDGRAARIDLGTAEEVSAALDAIATAGRARDGKRSDTPGLPEVRYAVDHMVCRYDPTTGDPVAWDRALREQLGSPKADLVRYQPVAAPVTELVALLERVLRFDWHARAGSFGLAAHIDWQRGLVVLITGAPATDEVARSLVELVGARGDVTTGADFGRGRRSGRAVGRGRT